MDLPKEIVDYCESCFKWDDDIRQEVYLEILALAPHAEINKAWCVAVYNAKMHNVRRDEGNRARLREDNHDLIVNNLGLAATADDPADLSAAEELILIKVLSLSAALRNTLIQYYVEGRSPETIAKMGNENVEAVRKRITRARNLLKGEV